MISCRALSTDNSMVEKKEELDTEIAKTPGVEFIVSCITGTMSNAKHVSRETPSDEPTTVIKKGVAFFIVTKSEAVEDDIIKIIHDVGSSDGSVTYIRPRGKNRDSKELAMASLKVVVKVSLLILQLKCKI